MSANDRTGVGAGSAEWGTPPDLFKRLSVRFGGFDYDPFASHENFKASVYSTVAGTFAFDGSEVAQLSDDDGLTREWAGRRVFMNPPYSRGLIEQCIEKAFESRYNADIIVALLPAATETRWFQRHILTACHIDWLPRRVHYIDPATGQPGGSPPSGAVIAVFKTDLMPFKPTTEASASAPGSNRELV